MTIPYEEKVSVVKSNYGHKFSFIKDTCSFLFQSRTKREN